MADEGDERRPGRRMSLDIYTPPSNSFPSNCGGGGSSNRSDGRQTYFHYHPMYNPFFPTYNTHPFHSDFFNSVAVFEPEEEDEAGNPYPPSLPDITAEYDPESPEYIPLPDSPPPLLHLRLERPEDDQSLPETPLRIRRFRSSVEEIPLGSRPFRYSVEENAEGFNVDELLASPISDQLQSDIMKSHKSYQAGSGCASTKTKNSDVEKDKGAAYFECNICLDMAMHPVVTSCGHLFCWPCLYQWLHVHSHHEECPTCKGKVTDSDITPIYGRGGLEDRDERNAFDSQPGLKIPPRPRGNRVEGWRQQITPEVVRERADDLTAWFTHRVQSMDERLFRQAHYGNSRNSRYVRQDRAGNGLPRARVRRIMGVERNHRRSVGTAALNNDNAPSNQQHNVLNDAPLPYAQDMWDAFAMASYGRTHAGGNSQFPTPTTAAIPVVPDPQPVWHAINSATTGDQPSTSSTMAVIEGDFAHNDGLADPNSAGSSRPLRRRAVRESTQASQAADIEGLHRRKRRH